MTATGVLPTVLVDPAWAVQSAYAHTDVTVVSGLTASVTDAARWQPGEREEWADLSLDWPTSWDDPHPTWISECASLMSAGALRRDLEPKLMARGDLELVRPLLATWCPQEPVGVAQWMKVIIARFGADAIPAALAVARKNPTVGVTLLQPLTGSGVTAQMADWLVRMPSMRSDALAWLVRHPGEAAAALVPVAVGELGTARAQAEHVLRLLAERGHHGTVLASAGAYGQVVVDAVRALLAVDRLEAPPPLLPKPPKWLDPAKLPQVLTRDRQPLPEGPRQVLCGILGMPQGGEVRGRIPAIRRGCDEASLAAFGWALLAQWKAVGHPVRDAWVVTAAGLLGDDDTVRRLMAQILEWRDSGDDTRALKGLDALAAIGSDIALTHLQRLSRTSTAKSLKRRAGELLMETARDRQMSEEELSDRIIPDFGLDATGRMVLDYGPRRFMVGFDEQLKPWVAEEGKARRATLPKPSAGDDQELASLAYRRFAALKKDVQAVASVQIRRLEQAMVSQRRWTAGEFQRLMVAHPLLGHLSQRLVWATFGGDGTPRETFRVAEDRSLATVEDDEYVLDQDAYVGVAHPVHIADEVSAWSMLFGDYQILQPFPQLGRDVFTFEEGEADQAQLSRFESIKVSAGKVLGLRSKDWRLEISGGRWYAAERTAGPHQTINIFFTPGIDPGDVVGTAEQELSHVWISAYPPEKARFDSLDPLTASEILRDLHSLAV